MTVRESFRYYHVIAVAGLYHFPEQDTSGDPSRQTFYFPALKRCIETHPMLSRFVQDPATKNERFVQAEIMDLRHHVNMMSPMSKPRVEALDDDHISRSMRVLHNDPELAMFDRPPGVPAWRIDVLPLYDLSRRILISFTYSHCVADGMSGPIFHNTFLAALNEKLPAVDAHLKINDAPIGILPHLPVSLSFLLGPALGHYLPTFITSLFGLKASASGSDSQTWVGPNFFDDRLSPKRSVNTGIVSFSLNAAELAAVLQACRSNNAKLTALLNELIAIAMSRALTKYYADFTKSTNLISCTPINLRKAASLPADALGNFAGGTYSRHPVAQTSDSSLNEAVWSRARVCGTEIAAAASSLQDQPTGLLAWISDMKSWMAGEIGHARDSSWEFSNLMAFDGGNGPITVEQMFFCQAANVVGQPVQFNVISVKGGDLAICASWQIGAIGLDRTDKASVEDNERKFVAEVLQDVGKLMKDYLAGN